jgi:hypothetical protein
MKNIWKFAKNHMKKNQRQQTMHVNAHRTQVLDYQIDDQVWLFIKNIQINRLSRKLNHKMFESFKILEKKKSFYKLDLSDEINVHSVFHISLLKKNLEDSFIKTNHFVIIINNDWRRTVTSSYARNVFFQVRNMFNKLISSFVVSRVMTTSSSRVCRLLFASYDSQNSMIITLRFSLFRIHFRTEEEIRAKRFEQKAKRSIETCDVLDSQARSSKFIIK